MDMGCGIPGVCYGSIINGLKELDLKIPYDNGLTFEDVDDISFETRQEGTLMQMRLITNTRRDTPDRNIGFVTIELNEGKALITRKGE